VGAGSSDDRLTGEAYLRWTGVAAVEDCEVAIELNPNYSKWVGVGGW
jgi:hypothetical protein